MPSKKLTGSQLKSFRHDVAALKSKGLVSKYKDARKQKPTRYMRAQVEKFRDVLEGKAQAVHVPRAKQVKAYSDKFRTKGNTVVVPVEKGERVHFDKRAKELIGVRYVNGHKVRKQYTAGTTENIIRLPELKRGQLYQISLGGGQIWRFDNKADLTAFMLPYEQSSYKPFKEWEKYVEIIRVDDADELDL